MTGTHRTEAAVSGLTDIARLVHLFYVEYCRMVRVENRLTCFPDRLPVTTWDMEGLPTVNKPAQRMEPPPPGSFYADEQLKEMDFRLANMSYYFGHEKKLIEDINEVKIVKGFKRNILI